MNLLPLRFRLPRAARRLFGWPSLRHGQFTPMRALMKGRDVLVVLPTGGGKSAIYQLPGALRQGPTLVVSPLLALQEDQLAGLNARDDQTLSAVRVSSAQTPKQQRDALDAVRDGRAKFLFITPEQLANPERMAEVKALKPGLVAVDEAHCVSAWGYDFRPDYLQLGHLIDELTGGAADGSSGKRDRPPVAALTATASPPVRADIAEALRLRDPLVEVTGLDRPNLRLAAVHCVTDEQRWTRLLAQIRQETPPGIVYAPTRAAAEQLAARLTEAGVPATAFHAGLSSGERTRRYDDFMADRITVMVATSAFGMGVDKSGIRFVHHVALPDSPDSYLQEIGRAGRDGRPASVVLFFRPEDVALQRYFASGNPQQHELVQLAAALREGPTTKTALTERTGLPARRLTQLLSLLEQVGAVSVGPGGQLTVPAYADSPARAATAALVQFERYQTRRRSQIDMMRQFAESGRCRGRALLAYFGEDVSHDCGHCDNCAAGSAGSASTREARRTPAARKGGDEPFPVASAVRHSEWGAGTVMSYEHDRMVVLFEEVGYKTLSVPIVRKGNLLQAVQAG
jgi:ATP-dependent DNA helicase RecQ